MPLGVGGLFNLGTGRLKNGLKVRINDEWGLSTILVLVEFDFRLLRAWRRKYMTHRHEVVSGAKLVVASENFLR